MADDKAAGGFYLIEWTCLPYTDQESGDLVVDGKFLYKARGTKWWYTLSDALAEKNQLVHVVMGDAKLQEKSEENPLPARYSGSLKKQQGKVNNTFMKLPKESYNFILDEILRREALEDPVYPELGGTADSESDSDSDSDSASS